MKNLKRLTAALLAVLLIIGTMPASALASEDNTPKEEVVYINLNADGSVKEINVVNIFELDADGRITDYGKYESLRNMTTTDEISYSGETVTIDAKAGKLYYEGKLDSTVMPWNIQVRYYMDGQELSAGEIAGKSGELKIALSISENTACSGKFFEGCALQASVTLDTDKCSDIKAEGATVANVGSNKQLTYTILPNKGADIEITAKVRDFEMSGIAINGIKLNLDIEIDDDEISGKIDELIGAVEELDEGADKLNDGAGELYDGTGLLDEKVGEMYDGVDALSGGAAELANGLAAAAAKNQELLDGAYAAFEGLCTASETILNAQLTMHGLQPVTLTPDTYDAVLTALLKTMDAEAIYNAARAEVAAKVEAQAESLYAGYIEQNAEEVYANYLLTMADDLYLQAAVQTITEQLLGSGYSMSAAGSYLKSEDGQALIEETVAEMTDEQKQQVIGAAAAKLTPQQKAQIRAGAVDTLTDEQKQQIKEGYIDQMMSSKEVVDKIAAATENSAAASVAELKAQLDNYGRFCAGLKEYTAGVGSAAAGADTLKINMNTLDENVGILKDSVKQLNEGAGELADGMAELSEGVDEFVKQTDGIDTNIGSEISSMVISATGSDVEMGSFVSEKNTNVEAVQFVIQTEGIELEEAVEIAPEAPEKLNFWQKLLRLFGLY